MSFNWWISKVWHIHTMEYYTLGKTEGTADTLSTWMNIQLYYAK